MVDEGEEKGVDINDFRVLMSTVLFIRSKRFLILDFKTIARLNASNVDVCFP